LGWKCQPLHTCLTEMFKFPGKIKRFFSTLVWGILRILKAIFAGISKYVGRGSSSSGSAMTGQLPDRAALVKELEVHHSSLFGDYALYAGSCAPCPGRIKGSFSLSFSDIAGTVTSLQILGMTRVWVASTPAPLLTLRGCTSCLWKWREDVSKIFKGSSAGDTEKYFSAGSCNPHTVGLCMMLDKVRSCRYRFAWESATVQPDRRNEEVSGSIQSKFCDSLAGVTLRLTNAGGGVRCPEVYRDQFWKSNGTVLMFRKEEITSLDMKQGCYLVTKTLKQFNSMCERAAEQHGMFEALNKWFTNKFGEYKYRNVEEPSSVKEVGMKCRKLFGCMDQDAKPPNGTRVEWDELTSALRAIISQVDNYRSEPGYYTIEEAAAEIVRLLDLSTREMSTFEGKVSQQVSLMASHTFNMQTLWGSDFEDLFLSEVWDDRCFEGLSTKVDLWRLTRPDKPKELPSRLPKQKTKLVGFYERLGRPSHPGNLVQGHNFHFFDSLAHTLGLWSWSGPDRCLPDWKVVTRVLRPVPKMEMGGKSRMLVANNVAGWEKGWDQGEVTFTTVGIGRYRRLRIRLVASKERRWYLASCFGRTCGGAERGDRLRRLTFRGAWGQHVWRFRQQAWDFVNVLEGTDDMLTQKGGGDKNLGLPKQGVSAFQEAVKLVTQWRDQVRQKNIVGLQDFELPKSWEAGEHAKLRDIVLGSPALQKLFEARDWAFVMHEKPGGPPLWELRLHDEAIATERDLESMLFVLRHSHWQASMTARDGIFDFGIALLAEAPTMTLYEAPTVGNASATQPNPFTSLKNGEIYTECTLETIETCFDSGIGIIEAEFIDPENDEDSGTGIVEAEFIDPEDDALPLDD